MRNDDGSESDASAASDLFKSRFAFLAELTALPALDSTLYVRHREVISIRAYVNSVGLNEIISKSPLSAT